MSILKNYTNTRGINCNYHRLVQVMVNETQALATIHSWPNKQLFEAAGNIPMSSIVETLEVPGYVLSSNTFASVEQWLITDQSSPFFGGNLDTDADEITRAKAAKQRLLRERRDVLESANVEVEGIGTIATDVSSQRLLTGAAVLALIATQAQQPFSLEWTLANLSSVELNATQIIACSVAVGTHVAGVFAAHRVAALAVENAGTIEEVNAVSL